MKLSIMIQEAKAEIKESICNVRRKYGIPASMMEGILNTIENEVLREATEELMEDYKEEIWEMKRKVPERDERGENPQNDRKAENGTNTDE